MADEDDRKLFVGGLPQEVSEEELNEHFGQFGEIESVNLKTDPNTGRSRGFCFVVYKVESCYDSIVVLDPDQYSAFLIFFSEFD